MIDTYGKDLRAALVALAVGCIVVVNDKSRGRKDLNGISDRGGIPSVFYKVATAVTAPVI